MFEMNEIIPIVVIYSIRQIKEAKRSALLTSINM